MDRLDEVVKELRSVAAPPAPAVPVRHRRLPKPVLIGIPVAALGAVLAVLLLHRTPATSVQPLVSTKPVGQWQKVMEHIDANRMQAFMDDDVTYLTLTDQWHSPASRSDLQIMTELRDRGLRLDRNPVHIDAVSEEYLSLAGDLKRVGLLVTDHLEAHNYVDKDGVIIESRPARGQQMWKIELRRAAASTQWLLFSAAPVQQQSVPSTHPGS